MAETTTTGTKKRATANTGAKRGPKKATATTKAVGAKPVGVTKKAAPAKKTSVATKVSFNKMSLARSLLTVLQAKGVVKKVEGAITANPAKKVYYYVPLL